MNRRARILRKNFRRLLAVAEEARAKGVDKHAGNETAARISARQCNRQILFRSRRAAKAVRTSPNRKLKSSSSSRPIRRSLTDSSTMPKPRIRSWRAGRFPRNNSTCQAATGPGLSSASRRAIAAGIDQETCKCSCRSCLSKPRSGSELCRRTVAGEDESD